MCGPAAIAIAGLVLTAASTGYTVYQSDQTTKAQNHINQQASDEGAALASESFKQQAAQVRLRDTQEADATAQQKALNERKATAARETARVSSGEAGVAGVSVDNLMTDFYRQQASYNDSLDQNLEWTKAQSSEELQGLRSGAIDRSIGSRRPQLNRPSYLAGGLDVGARALGTYDTYKFRTDKTYRGEG